MFDVLTFLFGVYVGGIIMCTFAVFQFNGEPVPSWKARIAAACVWPFVLFTLEDRNEDAAP